MTSLEEAICKLDDRLKAVPRRFAFLGGSLSASSTDERPLSRKSRHQNGYVAFLPENLPRILSGLNLRTPWRVSSRRRMIRISGNVLFLGA